jgi:hypothetical protein
MVDYLNVILKKYPGLIIHLKQEQEILDRLTDFKENSKLSLLHQGLLIEVLTRVYPELQPQ